MNLSKLNLRNITTWLLKLVVTMQAVIIIKHSVVVPIIILYNLHNIIISV